MVGDMETTSELSGLPFYVYMYMDPRPSKNLMPIYVGKGTAANDRAQDHWERPSLCRNRLLKRTLDKIRAAGLEPVITIVDEFDDESDAFAFEVELIAKYGRRDLGTGPLCNLTKGGEGGAGQVYTEERRERLRSAMLAPQMVETNRQRMLLAWQDPEFRQKITTRSRERLAEPEVRARMRAAIIASQTEEVRAKISAVARRCWESEEYREKWAAAKKLAHARPEEKARKSKATERLWAAKGDKMRAAIKAGKSSAEHRAEVGRKARQYYESEEARRQSAEFARAYNTPEVKAEKSRLLKERWADPVWRAQMLENRRAKKLARSEPPKG